MFSKRKEDSLKPSDAKQDVYLDSPIIPVPRTNHVYHIKSGTMTHHETVITFEGELTNNLTYFDLSSGNFGSYWIRTLSPCPSFLAEQAFPANSRPKQSSPIIYLRLNERIFVVKSLTVIFTLLTETKFGYDLRYEEADFSTDKCAAENEFLQLAAKKFVPNLQIKVGEYPIYSTGIKPDFESLDWMHGRFVSYNDNDRLDYQQYEKPTGKCHIRAHFLNLILEKHGVQTYKIFKYWQPADWKPFADKESWKFHSAAMTIDSRGNFWIWDPWNGYNKRLLTLNEWLFRDDEPKPRFAKITNSLCIDDDEIEYSLPNFMDSACHQDRDKLQDMISSAIPNPPESLPAGYSYYVGRTIFGLVNRLDPILQSRERLKLKRI